MIEEEEKDTTLIHLEMVLPLLFKKVYDKLYAKTD